MLGSFLMHAARRGIARANGFGVSPLGWIAAATGSLCLVLFPMTQWHELLAAGIVMATLLVTAAILARGDAGVTASVETPRRRIGVGERTFFAITVRNPGPARSGGATIEVPVGGVPQRLAVPRLAPGGETRLTVELLARARAVLSIGPVTVRAGDALGMIRRERPLTGRTTICIHPATIRLDALEAGVARDPDGLPNGTAVDDDLDVQGLREYVPGDDLRRVHWLNSSKTGTLMVRQYEATHRTDISLAVDVDPAAHASEAEFELAVSVYASLGVRYLAEGRRLSVHAGSRHTVPKRIPAFLDECSAIVPNGDGGQAFPSAVRHDSRASFRCLVVGSLRPLDWITRMAMPPSRSAGCLVLRIDEHAERTVHHGTGFTLVTVGALADLPIVMGALP